MEENSTQNPTLPTHEWLAILFLIVLLAALSIIALIPSDPIANLPKDPPKHIVDQEIEVFIEGAVEKPGSYIAKRGELVKDIVALAVPKDDADLQRLKLDKKLRKGQVIKVQSKIKKVKVSKASKPKIAKAKKRKKTDDEQNKKAVREQNENSENKASI
jgi:hypothetical protein